MWECNGIDVDVGWWIFDSLVRTPHYSLVLEGYSVSHVAPDAETMATFNNKMFYFGSLFRIGKHIYIKSIAIPAHSTIGVEAKEGLTFDSIKLKTDGECKTLDGHNEYEKRRRWRPLAYTIQYIEPATIHLHTYT